MTPAEPEPPSSPRLWELASWLLNQVASVGNREVAAAFGELSRRTPYAVLAGLDELGPTSQAELVRHTGIDRSDMVALMTQMEADDLVARRPDPADRRRNSIELTPVGRRLLHTLDIQADAAQDALLAPLAPDERTQLLSLLQRLLEYHSGQPPDP